MRKPASHIGCDWHYEGVTDEPNYLDPHDPIWDNPDIIGHTAESLITLGNDTYGTDDLLWNDAIKRGMGAMLERGYDLDQRLSKGVSDDTGERTYLFVKRRLDPDDDVPRRVYESAELVQIGKESRPDLPSDTHPNLWLAEGIQALSRQGWYWEQKGMAVKVGGTQLFVFRKGRSRKPKSLVHALPSVRQSQGLSVSLSEEPHKRSPTVKPLSEPRDKDLKPATLAGNNLLFNVLDGYYLVHPQH